MTKDIICALLLFLCIGSTLLLGSATEVDAGIQENKLLQEPKHQQQLHQDENGRTPPAEHASPGSALDEVCDPADNRSAAVESHEDSQAKRVGLESSSPEKATDGRGGRKRSPYRNRLITWDDNYVFKDEVNGEEENGENKKNEWLDKNFNFIKRSFLDFRVAGINIADDTREPRNLMDFDRDEPPFELYKDFDISEYIEGDENWKQLLAYRNNLERPSLSFYVDKVARKRWLPTQGYNQPKLHALFYASELKTTDFSGQVEEIKKQLPVNYSYAAKPTHKSMSLGTWLVDHNGDDATTRFTTKAVELTDEDGTFNATACAASLAQGLHEKCNDWESWALKNVRPGFVVEERWSSYENRNEPPHEFNLFTLWGRLWTGQWNFIRGQSRYWYAFVHRNGTVALTSPAFRRPRIPDWIPWDELVRLAEELGAHKDMFRTDIFVGRPANSHDLTSGDSSTQPSVEIAISECEIFPTTIFESDAFTDEGARLWKAGYKMGVYKLVENDEVPQEFLETGMISLQS
ncbi:hypothetical protein ACA910_006643 [Epithemia clementina (nom. ined.)]